MPDGDPAPREPAVGAATNFPTSLSHTSLQNDVECFRLRTKTHEMIIAPGPDCTLVVFQASPQEQARQAAAAAAAEKKEEEKA